MFPIIRIRADDRVWHESGRRWQNVWQGDAKCDKASHCFPRPVTLFMGICHRAPGLRRDLYSWKILNRSRFQGFLGEKVNEWTSSRWGWLVRGRKDNWFHALLPSSYSHFRCGCYGVSGFVKYTLTLFACTKAYTSDPDAKCTPTLLACCESINLLCGIIWKALWRE